MGGHMRIRTLASLTAAIILFRPTVVLAQDQAPFLHVIDSLNSSATYIDGGKWTLPTFSQVLETGPDIRADVMLDCVLMKSGKLNNCYVAEESGLVDQDPDRTIAVAFLRYAHVDPKTVESGVHDGDRHKFRYSWSDLSSSDLADAAKLPKVSDEIKIRYASAQWTFPTGAKFIYPARAVSDMKRGSAVVDCIIETSGDMQTCKIVSDGPVSYGFGDAAAKTFQKLTRVDPASVIGGIQSGDHILLKANWELN